MRASILSQDVFRIQGGQAQVFAGAQWNNLLYSVPTGNVPSGTAAWQTLTWDNGNSVWRATGKFLVDNNTGAITVPAGGSVTAPTFIGALTGNASTATNATNATTATNCTRTITGSGGVTGGGALTANQVLSLDTANSRNTDHTAVILTAGAGLLDTGTGDITASRTFAVGQGTGITVDLQNVGLNLTYTDGRYLGLTATAVDANAVVNQAGGADMKIYVGALPGTRTSDTIYFVTA
jgi:hypothetical protein